jgi:hypothetical protein
MASVAFNAAVVLFHVLLQAPPAGVALRVMSYNLLADDLVRARSVLCGV